MKIEVSIGEAIDKLSILELKLKKINNEDKKKEIEKEIKVLDECYTYIKKYEILYKLLIYVNESIWDMTDTIKSISITDSKFPLISNQIFEFNQKRFRIKNWFNLLANSNIKEQKNYSLSNCNILIKDIEIFKQKIINIYLISLEYDSITVISNFNTQIKQLINNIPIINYIENLSDKEDKIDIIFDDYNIEQINFLDYKIEYGIDENETEWLNYKVVMPENVNKISNQSNNKPKKLVFDIGANIGNLALANISEENKIISVKKYFNISNDIKIYYGTDSNRIDVTETALIKNKNRNIIHIPAGDENRARFYGDHVFGQLKTIYIESNKDSYIIDHNDSVYINLDDNTLGINYDPTKYNYELSILAIFKNETMNLKIWLDHYLWQGVEHFYLIDNDSNDNPMSILQEYIDKGLVTYYFKPEKYQQVQHYRNVFDNERLKEKTKWLCICDLDEFFFGTEKKLVDAIYEFNGYDVIYTNSFFYGCDNLIEHPLDIRISNIHRSDDMINGIKYFFKPKCINDTSEIWIHWLVHSGSGSLQKKILSTETFDNKKIRLNHYIVQSLEYWQNIKMKRGDVSVPQNEYIRTMKIFDDYEKIAIIKDDILKQIIENDLYDKNGEVMKFYNEHNNLIDNNSIEKPEQDLVNQYILEDDVVIELGARYGTVSCAINKKLKNKKGQISVEPDDRVWNALDNNKIKNNCNFNIIKGFISNKKLDLTNLGVCMNGYGATFIENNDTKIPSYSLDEIKTQYDINKFTALVADCEGFLEVFFDENLELYTDLRIVIFEADYADKCNYDKIKQNLILHKFVKIIEGHQNVWIKPQQNHNNLAYFEQYTKLATVKDDILKTIIENGYKNNMNDINTALIVEPRFLKHLPFVINDTHKKLGSKWKIVFYCGKGLKNIWINQLDKDIEIRELEYNCYKKNEYSDFMKSNKLWKSLYGKYVLVFSSSSFIINESPYNLDAYIKLNKSYIGGNQSNLCDELIRENINPQYKNFHGGLSLRKRLDMIRIINRFSTDSTTEENLRSDCLSTDREDIYFTIGCYKLNLPIGDDELCSHFSCHQIINNCFGANSLEIGYYLNLIQTYSNICDNIYLFKNIEDIENEFLILHQGGGFFSNCTLRLFDIILYFNTTKKLPMFIDGSKQFELYKCGTNKNDITYEYFTNDMDTNIIYSDKIDFYEQYQYINYNNLNFNGLSLFIKKYFSPSKQIIQLCEFIKKKYSIYTYNNICVLFYRGNDKATERILPNYNEFIKKATSLYEKNNNIKFLIQSDEIEFINSMTSKFPNNTFYFEEEIRTINKNNYLSVDLVNKESNFIYSKYYLAITIIMSQCKNIICTTGNCSLWITLFRGNADNVHQI